MSGRWGRPAAGGRDRGISVPLSHAVTLAITTVVLTGLLVSAGGYLEDQRATAARGELSTVGAELAADLGAADRLADGSANATLSLAVSLPAEVSGGAYAVALGTPAACPTNEPSTACLVLRSPRAGVEVTLPFRNETAVANGTVGGGRLAVVYENRTLTLEERP